MIRGRLYITSCFLFCSPKDDACGADSEERTVFENAAFAVAEDFIVNECTRIARTVSKHGFQCAVLSTRHIHDAMQHVYIGLSCCRPSVGATPACNGKHSLLPTDCHSWLRRLLLRGSLLSGYCGDVIRPYEYRTAFRSSDIRRPMTGLPRILSHQK